MPKNHITPPDDGFDGWAELVGEAHTDKFFTDNESDILGSGFGNESEYNRWLFKLFYDVNVDPKQAAQIIEFAYKIRTNVN